MSLYDQYYQEGEDERRRKMNEDQRKEDALREEREHQRRREYDEYQRQQEQEEYEIMLEKIEEAKTFLMKNGYLVFKYSDLMREYNKINGSIVENTDLPDDYIPF